MNPILIEDDGEAAIALIERESFDALVLDIGLPGADGFAVCRSVRSHFDGPIIVLTARGEEIDEVIALEVGADDFMSKPVRPRHSGTFLANACAETIVICSRPVGRLPEVCSCLYAIVHGAVFADFCISRRALARFPSQPTLTRSC